jgi:hypothetical protein
MNDSLEAVIVEQPEGVMLIFPTGPSMWFEKKRGWRRELVDQTLEALEKGWSAGFQGGYKCGHKDATDEWREDGEPWAMDDVPEADEWMNGEA